MYLGARLTSVAIDLHCKTTSKHSNNYNNHSCFVDRMARHQSVGHNFFSE